MDVYWFAIRNQQLVGLTRTCCFLPNVSLFPNINKQFIYKYLAISYSLLSYFLKNPLEAHCFGNIVS